MSQPAIPRTALPQVDHELEGLSTYLDSLETVIGSLEVRLERVSGQSSTSGEDYEPEGRDPASNCELASQIRVLGIRAEKAASRGKHLLSCLEI